MHCPQFVAGALNNVRVIDLTSVFLGPVCTQMLGDLGADVVKIEGFEGDSTRWLGPSRTGEMGPLFLHANRNKRSIAIDLKRPEGVEIVLRLMGGADVFVSNMREAALHRLGLDYATVSEKFPRLVYCHAIGYGADGPYAGMPAFDDAIQSISGLAMIQGHRSGVPEYVNTVVADKVTGMMAAFGIASALLARERGGEGQKVDVPMFETMVWFVMMEHLYGETFVPKIGGSVYPRAVSKGRRPYKTTDGYIAVMPYLDRQWQRFFDMIGESRLSDDPRFSTMASRNANIDELYELLGSELAKRSTETWLQMCRASDIPAVPVVSPSRLLNDPHLRARGFFQMVEHPLEGKVVQMQPPLALSGTPASVRRQAPGLGEHTRQILEEIGYSSPEMDSLHARGVVR